MYGRIINTEKWKHSLTPGGAANKYVLTVAMEFPTTDSGHIPLDLVRVDGRWQVTDGNRAYSRWQEYNGDMDLFLAAGQSIADRNFARFENGSFVLPLAKTTEGRIDADALVVASCVRDTLSGLMLMAIGMAVTRFTMVPFIGFFRANTWVRRRF